MHSLNTELKRVLDTLALEKEMRVSLKTKHPWYDQEMRILKRHVRKVEKKWLKYGMDSCWTNYKKARNSYYYKLNHKKDMIRHKISECSNDSRKLHKLINNLTKPKEEQEWPEHTNDEELANTFASYFENKILQIRKALETTPPFTTEQELVPKLSRLAPMTESEMLKVINSLKTTIPTDILKKVLPSILPLITKIVNLSLTKGAFCRSWKIAVVWLTVNPLQLQTSQ